MPFKKKKKNILNVARYIKGVTPEIGMLYIVGLGKLTGEIIERVPLSGQWHLFLV